MFLCSPQAAQNRDLQKGPHKGSFLPPQPSEKLGEILAYLPSPALNKTETIKKEGEGATETLAKFVFVVLFVGLGFFLGFFLASFGSNWSFGASPASSVLGEDVGSQRFRILLFPILKFLGLWGFFWVF